MDVVDEDTLRRRIAAIDEMTAENRRIVSAATAQLSTLRAERRRLLTENPAPRTPGQVKYAAQMARKADKHNRGQ